MPSFASKLKSLARAFKPKTSPSSAVASSVSSSSSSDSLASSTFSSASSSASTISIHAVQSLPYEQACVQKIYPFCNDAQRRELYSLDPKLGPVASVAPLLVRPTLTPLAQASKPASSRSSPSLSSPKSDKSSILPSPAPTPTPSRPKMPAQAPRSFKSSELAPPTRSNSVSKHSSSRNVGLGEIPAAARSTSSLPSRRKYDHQPRQAADHYYNYAASVSAKHSYRPSQYRSSLRPKINSTTVNSSYGPRPQPRRPMQSQSGSRQRIGPSSTLSSHRRR